jgi:hypothetical protein
MMKRWQPIGYTPSAHGALEPQFLFRVTQLKLAKRLLCKQAPQLKDLDRPKRAIGQDVLEHLNATDLCPAVR